jgi:hypothetical protein
VVGDRGDGENPRATPIQGDNGVDLRGYRARLQSDRIWEELSDSIVGDGDDGEHSPAMLIQATMCEGRSRCKWRPFGRNYGNRYGFRRIQSETTVREKMGRTL